jgi:DHA1 family multidrug resistance protein-like MFS transporter
MAAPMRPTRAPTLILFASLVIVMLGFGIVVPIMPFYVTHFGASGQALGFLMAIYSIMQFLFAPLWGRLSDRLGRKPILLTGVAGFALAFGLQGLSQNLVQLFLARGLAGILSSATLPTALAYIADTTDSRDRAGGMGLMGAAMGLGMIFGPLLAGPLTLVEVDLPDSIGRLFQYTIDPSSGARLDLSLPFLAASALALVNIAFIVLALPESLPAETRSGGEGHTASRLSQLTAALRGPMAFLFVAAFLLAFALANLESILGLFGKDRFNMGPAQVGGVMGLIGILSVIQQGVVIGPLTRRIGEVRVLRLGLAVSVTGLVGLALVPGMAQMIAMAVVFNAGNALLRPSVATLISQRAETGQGVAMGLENSFMSLGRVVGPIWGGFSFDLGPTLPFWSAALVQALALGLSLGLLREQARAPSPAALG